MSPLLNLLNTGEFLGSAFAGGMLVNLSSSVVWDQLAPVGPKLKNLLQIDEEGEIKNHDLQRSIVYAQCRSAIDVIDRVLLEDYGAERSKLKDLLTSINRFKAGAGSNDEVQLLWGIRGEIAKVMKAVRDTDREIVDQAILWPGSADQLLKAGVTSPNDFQSLREEVVENLIHVLAQDVAGQSLPDSFKKRLREEWFDLFSLAFREEVKTNERTRTAYFLKAFEDLETQLGLQSGLIEDGFDRLSKALSHQSRSLQGIRSVLDSLVARIDGMGHEPRENDWSQLAGELESKIQTALTDYAISAQRERKKILNTTQEIRRDVKTLLKGFRLGETARPRELPPEAERLVGREQSVKDLIGELMAHKKVAVVAVGGVGKTALCAKVIREFEKMPEGVAGTKKGIYAHDFYQKPSMEDFYETILRQAQRPEEDVRKQLTVVHAILHQPGILLYLEGAEKLNDKDQRELLTLLGSEAFLLLTSRPPYHGSLKTFEVDPLTTEEGAELIAGILSASKESCRELARYLGGHPLACQLAATTARKGSRTADEFLERLIEQGLSELDPLRPPSENLSKEVIGALCRQIVESLITDCPVEAGDVNPAVAAFHRLSLGNTLPTPLSVLRELGSGEERVLALLVEHGLAESSRVAGAAEEEPAYALKHALLGEWAKNGLSEWGRSRRDLAGEGKAWSIDFGNELFKSKKLEGGPVRYSALVALTEAILKECLRSLENTNRELLWLFWLPAGLHQTFAIYGKAEELWREALEEISVETENAETDQATILNNLAQLLKATNRLEEAEPLMRRALTIEEGSYGAEHPNVARGLNNLALLLKTTNRLEEAEPLMRRALTIDEGSYGAEHPDVAIDLNNLAHLLQATNRLEEAEPLMRRALTIDEGSYGAEHPNVARDLNNLALLLKATNRLEEAEPLMRRALTIDEGSYGAEHPDVAIDLNNLAHLLQATNRLEEAEPLMRRALTIDEGSYGAEHPNVARDLNNLAQLLQATNRLEEAEPLMRRALTIDEGSYGAEHPDVAIDLNNLAQLLQATNRLEEAEPLMRRGLFILFLFKVRTGHPNPNIDAVVRNFVSLRKELGETEEVAQAAARQVASKAGLG